MPPHQTFGKVETAPAPAQTGVATARKDAAARAATFRDDSVQLSGVLHIYVALDWGEEINLEQAKRLFPWEMHALPRRRRTPASIAYSHAPLHYPLAAAQLDLPELGRVSVSTEATVVDFGGVSVAMHVPFRATAAQLTKIAASLSDSRALTREARAALAPLHAALLPAIESERFSELTEEYFVFEMPPGDPLPAPEVLIAEHADWIAALGLLEPESLSADEISQAVRSHISYSPRDLFLPEWSAALLIDENCGETLQVIEFANLQLLKYRFLDDLLDERLDAAYRMVHPPKRTWRPFRRIHDRSLRALGKVKIDANSMFDRANHALKLVGDQYLARVYQMLQARFHLKDWERSIERSLDLVQSVYQVFSDQAANYRAEFLEIVIILLIAFEIAMALAGR